MVTPELHRFRAIALGLGNLKDALGATAVGLVWWRTARRLRSAEAAIRPESSVRIFAPSRGRHLYWAGSPFTPPVMLGLRSEGCSSIW